MKGQVTKWLGIAAGIWVQALAGNGNVFPNFAPALKQQLYLNQIQLNNLGVAKDFGENVGLLAGVLSNLLAPWVILLIGALEGFLAYGTLWLVMSGLIAPLPYWQMCAVLMFGANSFTFYNTAVLVTCMRNFPNSRGTVAGIIKGFIGLSSAIFTQIYVAVLKNNATDLVLLLAVAPSVVCLLAMYFVRPVTGPNRKQIVDPSEHSGFVFIHVICIGLAVYLIIATFVENFVQNIPPVVYQVIIALMLVFLFSPLAVPAKFAYGKFLIRREKRRLNSKATSLSTKVDDDVREHLLKSEENYQQGARDSSGKPLVIKDEEGAEPNLPANTSSSLKGSSNDDKAVETSLQNFYSNTPHDGSKVSADSGKGERRKSNAGCFSIPKGEYGEVDPGTLLAVGEGAVRRRKGPRRGEDFTLMQALVKADFWLLFFTFFCGVGTIITAINNLGQIGQAQGYSDVTIFVSLYGIMNFLGRLAAGSVSERFVRSSALPRTIWMMTAQVAMIMGYFLFAFAVPGSLYVGAIVLGLCYGVHVSIMVPVASELFGLQHFGMIYNFITLGNPIGSLLFSGVIAGYLYDRESHQNPYLHIPAGHILTRFMQTMGESEDEVPACLGAHCFRLTFVIMAGVGMVGVILNVILTMRIRRVYQALYGLSASRSNSTADLTRDLDDGRKQPTSPGTDPLSPASSNTGNSQRPTH